MIESQDHYTRPRKLVYQKDLEIGSEQSVNLLWSTKMPPCTWKSAEDFVIKRLFKQQTICWKMKKKETYSA